MTTMLPDLEPDQIRQETSISAVEREIRECAIRFALLGEVQFSERLIGLLLQNGSTLDHWYFIDALKFAWKAVDRWPEGWPDDRSNITSEQQHQKDRNRDWVGLPRVSKNDENLAALEACLDVEDDKHADATTGASAMYKSQRLIRALEISLALHGNDHALRSKFDESHTQKKTRGKDGQAVEQQGLDERFKVSDLDPQSADILSRIVARWRANQQIDYLVQARRLWPYFVRGLLADAGDLSKSEIENKGQTLLQAFENRYMSGYAPSPLAGKGIRELLEIGERNTREHYRKEGNKPDEIPETLFKQPATDEEIEELEDRLETILPDDFKEFLKISNGFGHGESGVFNSVFPDPALFDASKLEWNEEEYFQLPVDLLDLPREYEEIVGMETRKSEPDGDFDWDTAFPIFDRVLEVGVQDIDNLWLVHPQLVEQTREQYHKMLTKANEKQKKVIVRAMESFAGSKEEFERMNWCFAKWSSGGSAHMSFYASFSKYLEHVVVESMKDKYSGR